MPAKTKKAAKKPAKKPAKAAARKPATSKSAKQPAKKSAKPASKLAKGAAKPPAKRKPAKQVAPPAATQGDDLLWLIVDRVRHVSSGKLGASCDAFRKDLDALDDDQLLQVETAFCAAMQRAYNWSVWGAAYVIHGGCSDDAFWDFRAGLIALGRETYEAALADPETLAAIADIENKTLMEGFQYVPGKLLQARGLESLGGGHGRGAPTTGTNWGEDEELVTLYPKLSARFDD